MKLWSILIPTMESRKPLYDKMVATLKKQIKACGAEEEIEVIGRPYVLLVFYIFQARILVVCNKDIRVVS